MGDGIRWTVLFENLSKAGGPKVKTSKFNDKRFWVDTLDRAVSSFAQGLLATATLTTFNVVQIDWESSVISAVSYAIFSTLSSIALRGGENLNEPQA